MSKGGDTTTTSTTSQLPAFVEPYYKDLLARAQTSSNAGYVPYANQRLANFSTDTNSSFDIIRQQAAGGLPAGVAEAGSTASGIANYLPGQIGTTGLPDVNINQYMNPYVQNVLDVQKARANQNFAEQQAGRNDAAIKAGAFGGNRRFVQDAIAQRENNAQLQQIEAEGLSSAYDRATAMYTSDAQRRLQADMANEDARRMGASLGLDAAKAQMDFAQQGQNMRLQQAEALSNVGAKTQQRQQAGLDMAYQDFINQRDWDKNQLMTYSQILQGLPVTPNTTTTTTQPAPSFLSQIAGIATTGLGIWDLFN